MAAWISAIASSVGALGVLLLWWQLRLMKQQISQDHERSRRERAIELFKEWNQFERSEGHLAAAIAEHLDSDAAQAVWKGASVEFPSRYKGTLERFLSRNGKHCVLTVEGKTVALDESWALELRSGMLECMNLIETILTAARHHVADTDMIKEQFSGLIDPLPNRRRTMMRNMREAAGGAISYPSSSMFDQAILEEKRPSAAQKEVLG